MSWKDLVAFVFIGVAVGFGIRVSQWLIPEPAQPIDLRIVHATYEEPGT